MYTAVFLVFLATFTKNGLYSHKCWAHKRYKSTHKEDILLFIDRGGSKKQKRYEGTHEAKEGITTLYTLSHTAPPVVGVHYTELSLPPAYVRLQYSYIVFSLPPRPRYLLLVGAD